ATLEYKFTCGNWDTVEKGPRGEEIDNRRLEVTGDKTENVTVAAWRNKDKEAAAPAPAAAASTITGDVRRHEHFASKQLGNERRLLVWLPPGYEHDAARRYPVLYLHDGQN